MSLEPVRVLVADDEAHIRQVIARIVETLGARVVAEAAEGQSAVDLCALHRPDVAILDINMPVLTGDRVLARVMQAQPELIVVMMTAQDTIDAVRECLKLGARDYILKSNPAEQIYSMLREAWPEYEREIRERTARPHGE